MTTQKQIEANQLNAQLSTGPTSNEGKTIVSQNALKHGILSKHIIICNEKKEEFDQIKQSFYDDLKPKGAVEEMLVERIVTCYWRLQRVIIAEGGAIKKRYDRGWFDRVQKRAKQADEYMLYSASYSFKTEKLTNSVSATRCIERLKELKDTVERLGYLPEDERDDYMELTGTWLNKDASKGFLFFCFLAEGKVDGEDKEKGKKAILMILDQDIDTAEKMLKGVKLIEDEDDQAEAMTELVPDSETIEKLARYETSLEKGLYQALVMLQKLREERNQI